MNNRNSNFLKQLGLTQTALADILNVKQPTVHAGLQRNADYFTPLRLSQLAKHLRDNLPDELEAFEEARQLYISDPNSFQSEEPGRSTALEALEFAQQWVVGDSPREQRDLVFVDDLLKSRVDDSGISLVYAVSNWRGAISLFNILAAQIAGRNDCIQIYLFEIPILRYFPKLRILDPQSKVPKVFGHLANEEEASLSPSFAEGLIQMFRENGLGLLSDRFVDDDKIPSSPDFRLVAKPLDFIRGELPSAHLHAV
ncbi:hypothetical protein OJ996_22490 [Luteolibacter sp. GHJ8]|uniref:HTH cro/C1-type domain-containing protein n=1 Tax=Luteolibacter rhizosphaerae TaxID=2989719 RepID=A0ABT3G9T9_9BACT|nr:hypothetical protein [Luteolibacter rhizosphaerae]MCW1916374.1 hypothetical protein [Luteolibacter rhizosphaerae]